MDAGAGIVFEFARSAAGRAASLAAPAADDLKKPGRLTFTSLAARDSDVAALLDATLHFPRTMIDIYRELPY